MKKGWAIFPLLLLIAVAACKKNDPRYPIEPHIALVGITKDTIRSGSSKDSIYVRISFTDGDADIGNDAGSGNYDLYVKDSRDTAYLYTYYFPEIDEQYKDPAKGMEGKVDFLMKAAFFTLRPDHPFLDTFNFSIYIKDRAGHASNVVTTQDIIIVP